jgi:hypothetical protein
MMLFMILAFASLSSRIQALAIETSNITAVAYNTNTPLANTISDATHKVRTLPPSGITNRLLFFSIPRPGR